MFRLERMNTFQIGDGEMTAREVQKVIEHLVKQNPNMTIAQYLESQHKIKVCLV